MADGARPAVGLSVGATRLAAVTVDHAVTRRPVLTLYPQRPPEVGVPSENPHLTGRGLVITDFVNRVGDPAGVVAADGSRRRSETLLAAALRAVAYAATGERTLPAAAVSYPAHWKPAAVDALHTALSRVTEWSHRQPPVLLLPDSAAALTALHASPGLPSRGIIAVCDFGGSGTSITVVDAADDYRPVGPTVRYTDFSGDFLDQALLTHLLNDLSATDPVDTSSTSSIGSLNRLRTVCRIAKEQLSSSTTVRLTAQLPNSGGDISLTRAELDEVIRPALHLVVGAVQETLKDSGISGGDLLAVASVGGGANIPLVNTTLSHRFSVPVITAPRPHLTAAVGAALRVATVAGAVADPAAIPALPYDGHPGRVRPAENLWSQRPVAVILGAALLVLGLGAAIVIVLHRLSAGEPSPPAPGVGTAPQTTTTIPAAHVPAVR